MSRSTMVRVLLVEDSATVRAQLVALLRTDAALDVIGTAGNGVEAVAQAERLRPDVILMDLHLPVADGYEASRLIMERVPTPIVMTTAPGNPVPRAPEEVGALMLVHKPGAFPGGPADADGARLLQAVKLMAEVKVIRRWRPTVASRPVRRLGRRVRCVAMGASAGGPAVITEILRPLAPGLPVPVLLVQHISPGFTETFVEWLRQSTGLEARVAEDGARPRRGTIHVAPEGRQMGLGAAGEIRLRDDPAVAGFRPSISYLFASVAQVCGPAAVGVLLTGMGRDGADGLLRLRQGGGATIVQDEASCAVFGMPLEAIRCGAAERGLPPAEITATLRQLLEADA